MAASNWTFLGTAQKNASYDLSSTTYKEIFVVLNYSDKSCMGLHITPLTEGYNIYNGYTTATPRCIQVIYNSSTHKINIRNAFNEASSPTSYTNYMSMDVYYR